MGVVDGMHAGRSRGVGHVSEDVGALPECEVKTPEHTASRSAALGRSSRNWLIFLESLSTGRQEKVLVCCPRSRLTTRHGAPRTH